VYPPKKGLGFVIPPLGGLHQIKDPKDQLTILATTLRGFCLNLIRRDNSIIKSLTPLHNWRTSKPCGLPISSGPSSLPHLWETQTRIGWRSFRPILSRFFTCSETLLSLPISREGALLTKKGDLSDPPATYSQKGTYMARSPHLSVFNPNCNHLQLHSRSPQCRIRKVQDNSCLPSCNLKIHFFSKQISSPSLSIPLRT
jgi:hypothetical protein